MKCQFCDNPATVHLTDIVNKKKRELHLCEGCARKHDLIPDDSPPQVNLQALLNLILGHPQAGGPPDPPAAPGADPAALKCPACGLKYVQFRADGRLGCPHDYDAFRHALEPLLERVHRGTRHAGKVPAAVRRTAAAEEVRDLKRRLTDAVAAEKYEDAARLRDLIRQKEASDEPR